MRMTIPGAMSKSAPDNANREAYMSRFVILARV